MCIVLLNGVQNHITYTARVTAAQAYNTHKTEKNITRILKGPVVMITCQFFCMNINLSLFCTSLDAIYDETSVLLLSHHVINCLHSTVYQLTILLL